MSSIAIRIKWCYNTIVVVAVGHMLGVQSQQDDDGKVMVHLSVLHQDCSCDIIQSLWVCV